MIKLGRFPNITAAKAKTGAAKGKLYGMYAKEIKDLLGYSLTAVDVISDVEVTTTDWGHKEDWEETEKYYNLVEQNAPNNIEALFFSAYAKFRKEPCKNLFNGND